MDVRSIIALLMGLVIQLSQVQLCAAAPGSCGTAAQKMSCCDTMQSCPCAKENKPKEKPVPLFPAGVDLKLLVSKSAEPDRTTAPVVSPKPDVSPATSRPEPRLGYAGVPLSVAFCTFVI